MTVVEDYVAISTTGGGLQILDYQDPANPLYLSGIYCDPGYLMPTEVGVAVLSQTILNDLKVAVVDLSDLAAPDLHDFTYVGVGELWTWSSHNNLLFTFSHLDGDGNFIPAVEYFVLTVLNNQGRPQIAYSERRESHSFTAISHLWGERLLFHSWSRGFVIYDITNPFQPETMVENELPYAPCYMSADGRYAVVYNQLDYMHDLFNLIVLDCVGDEETPPLTVLSELNQEGAMHCRQLDNTRMLVQVGAINTIYDLTNPAEPTIEARFEMDGSIYPVGNDIWRLDPVNLDLYDGRNMEQIEFVSRYSKVGSIFDISQTGNRLVSANDQGGFDIFNLNLPVNPELDYSFLIPAKMVSLGENRAYVVTNDSTIVLYDLSNPAEPDSQSCIMYHNDRFGNISQIESYGDYLIVNNNWGYSEPIQFYDFRDPHHPVGISELRIGLDPVRGSFEVDGDRMITFASPDDSVQLCTDWDISDPSNPTLVSTFPIAKLTGRYPQGLSGFAVDGDYLHLLIRTLIHPRQSPHDYQDTAMYVYRLYDISDQNEPQLLDTLIYIPINVEAYDDPFVPELMTAKGIYAVIRRDKLGSIDIIEGWRNSSRRKASFETAQPVNDIIANEQFLYIATGRSISVWDMEDLLSTGNPDMPVVFPKTFMLSAFPNPFNSSTTISYSLPTSGRYAIDVIDLQGRLVTRLSDGWHEAGCYREVWDGGKVGSGLYNIVIDYNGNRSSLPLVLIK